jgi:phytoene dehydrogenase-like protein
VRVVVVGAGVGGLAVAVRLAAAGHGVTVVEQGGAPGGKAGSLELPGPADDRPFRFDTGPSLLTMPWTVRELFAETGAPADEAGVELVRVEPVTRYRFADGSAFAMSADLPAATAALEAWSPGAGADWVRFLGLCAGMWRAAVPFLSGPPPWPPHRRGRPHDSATPPRPLRPPGPWPARPPTRLAPRRGGPHASVTPPAPRPDPRDLVRVRPWQTLRDLARACVRDPRLRTVVERFATYAGADPRRAPAALAVAGYVEHAFGAWHVRGGLYRIVEALARRLDELGGELRLDTRAVAVERTGGRAVGVLTAAERIRADAVVWDGDALALDRALGRARRGRPAERSLSGLAVMLGLRGRTPGLVHHEIRFPGDYEAEFDDLFVARRPVAEPTLYVSASCATDPGAAPAGAENWFVLTNAPAGVEADWEAEADRAVSRLGVAGRVVARAVRSPGDLERETGAVDGAIYGAAPHGRLGTLRRPARGVRGVRNLLRVGGTVHPGGGLPLVMLGAATAARELDPQAARSGSAPPQVPDAP